jgi:hypothetical protein
VTLSSSAPVLVIAGLPRIPAARPRPAEVEAIPMTKTFRENNVNLKEKSGSQK